MKLVKLIASLSVLLGVFSLDGAFDGAFDTKQVAFADQAQVQPFDFTNYKIDYEMCIGASQVITAFSEEFFAALSDSKQHEQEKIRLASLQSALKDPNATVIYSTGLSSMDRRQAEKAVNALSEKIKLRNENARRYQSHSLICKSSCLSMLEKAETYFSAANGNGSVSSFEETLNSLCLKSDRARSLMQEIESQFRPQSVAVGPRTELYGIGESRSEMAREVRQEIPRSLQFKVAATEVSKASLSDVRVAVEGANVCAISKTVSALVKATNCRLSLKQETNHPVFGHPFAVRSFAVEIKIVR